ncbi:MAG: hypothetical protein ACMXX6_01975 [Candidatus Woesearchaeota archaeon]
MKEQQSKEPFYKKYPGWTGITTGITLGALKIHFMLSFIYQDPNPFNWSNIQRQHAEQRELRREELISELEQDIFDNVSKRFFNYDINGDGLLSKSEFICGTLRDKIIHYEPNTILESPRKLAKDNLYKEYCK